MNKKLNLIIKILLIFILSALILAVIGFGLYKLNIHNKNTYSDAYVIKDILKEDKASKYITDKFKVVLMKDKDGLFDTIVYNSNKVLERDIWDKLERGLTISRSNKYFTLRGGYPEFTRDLVITSPPVEVENLRFQIEGTSILISNAQILEAPVYYKDGAMVDKGTEGCIEIKNQKEVQTINLGEVAPEEVEMAISVINNATTKHNYSVKKK